MNNTSLSSSCLLSSFSVSVFFRHFSSFFPHSWLSILLLVIVCMAMDGSFSFGWLKNLVLWIQTENRDYVWSFVIKRANVWDGVIGGHLLDTGLKFNLINTFKKLSKPISPKSLLQILRMLKNKKKKTKFFNFKNKLFFYF